LLIAMPAVYPAALWITPSFTSHVPRLPPRAARRPTPLDFGLSVEAVRQVGNGQGGKIIPIAELEKQAILSAVAELNCDKLQTARLLGIGKTTL
jgi:hypothetical protein